MSVEDRKICGIRVRIGGDRVHIEARGSRDGRRIQDGAGRSIIHIDQVEAAILCELSFQEM
jgi:hypothetical protein